MSAPSCVMGACPIPWECRSVGQCYEASAAPERERLAEEERRFYDEQERAYYDHLEGREQEESGLGHA